MNGSAGAGNQGMKEDWSGGRVHGRGHSGINSSATCNFTLSNSVIDVARN